MPAFPLVASLLCGAVVASAPAQNSLPAPSVRLDRSLPLEIRNNGSRFEDAMKAQIVGAAQVLAKLTEQELPPSQLHALYTLVGGVLFLDRNYFNAAVAFKKAERIGPLDEGHPLHSGDGLCRRWADETWARPELERSSREGEPANFTLPVLACPSGITTSRSSRLRWENSTRRFRFSPDFMKAHDSLGLSLEALQKNTTTPPIATRKRLN